MADQAPAINPAEDEMDEELEDIPDNDKEADALFRAKIRREVQGKMFFGQVEDIEQGKITRDRLYRIKYEDGDLEHLTGDQVREMMVSDGKDDDAEDGDEQQEVSKKPAARGKIVAETKASAKGKAKAKAESKAKAKAKATPKAKGKPAPKAKAKAVEKNVSKKPAKK
eukprot:TRINITY_DN63548_c0_g1_i1.p1 TRINITY_DN63548_c0_g1~~TRINITY_DN63548_c0_g1_i1.p1  ORF type:complete len:168 (-),score=69.54 TRINITY_DN63548_c0_g1_i1:276-779(-)